MRIEVKLFATLRLKLGRGSVTVETEDQPTVAQLIELVGQEVGRNVREFLLTDEGDLQIGTMILLDGTNIHHLQGLDTPVTQSEVSIFPPAGGG
ncbi:MAG: MoaD/ThiS family protein [Alkalispirochaetaceae bacterium]